jgi:hypothetical protein
VTALDSARSLFGGPQVQNHLARLCVPLCPFLCTAQASTSTRPQSRQPTAHHLCCFLPQRAFLCLAFLCAVSVLRSSHPVSTEQDFLTFFRDDPWHVLGMFVCLSWIDPPSYSPLCCNYDDAARLPPFERWPFCSRVAFIMRCVPLHLFVSALHL